MVRTRSEVSAEVEVGATRLHGPYGLVKLRVDVRNRTGWDNPDGGRDSALCRSLVAAHTLLAVSDGAFLSLLEHPEWASAAVADCDNRHSWPVLVGASGRSDVVLSSPIILYDQPEIAPESPADLHDGTEIDEILTLRTLALTEEEK
ncbi:MAG: hypothetical protein ACRDU8_11195, partial [Egibacteraceae bacterium]